MYYNYITYHISYTFYMTYYFEKTLIISFILLFHQFCVVNMRTKSTIHNRDATSLKRLLQLLPNLRIPVYLNFFSMRVSWKKSSYLRDDKPIFRKPRQKILRVCLIGVRSSSICTSEAHENRSYSFFFYYYGAVPF